MDVNNDAGGNNGGENKVERPAWLDSAPDAYKNNEAFYGFKQPADFFGEMDSYLKAKDRMVVVPGENATDDERKAFYSKIGVPEAPDKYELEDLKVEQYTAEADKMFRELMLKSNVPKGAAKSVHKAFVEMIQQGVQAQAKQREDQEAAEQKAVEDGVNALKDQWKGEDFKVNTELANRALKATLQWAGISAEEAQKFTEESKIGNVIIGSHPTVVKMFHAIAQKIGNDTMGGFRSGSGGGELSPEDRAKKRFPNTQFTT